VKIVAFATPAAPVRLGVLLDTDTILDLTHPACALPPANGNDAYDLDGAFLPAAQRLVTSLTDGNVRSRLAPALLPRRSVTLHAPVPRPGKILCIGLNYRDHAEEQGAKLPSRPLLFSKFGTCVLAPGGTIRIPKQSLETDYEAELGVVIGRRASGVTRSAAMAHVLGYCNFHDVSARDYQFADGQWVRGKSCDTFAPFGEYIATTDEIPDPHTLGIRLRLNGTTMQDSNTNQLVFDVPALIEAISADITLEPGDVIATGTPPGVGFARKPPVYLRTGDVVEVEIDGLGVLRNPVA
jgi:2-keto-4-pentenoate hydratase/2-oxohepta-3-ene-1,7-dioic acid hydratase in catechol pathway